MLLDSNRTLKIADFGVARVEAMNGEMTGETGTLGYMAPEVFYLRFVNFDLKISDLMFYREFYK